MSVMNFPHTAYLASLAFPLAALGGIGLILAWRDPHVRRSKVRFALPIAVAIHTIWSLVLIAHYPQFAGWLLGVAAVLGGGLTLILFGRALGWHNLKRRMPIAAVLAVVMLAPLTWSLSTLDNPYGGTANDAYAGPPAPSVGRSLAQSQGGYGVGLDSNRATPSTDRIETKIYDYAKARSGSLPFVLATDTWRSAAPIIMDGGARVLPMGGYTSRVPAPSATGLRQLVAANSVHFVLLTGADSKSGVSTPNVFEIQHWVRSACRFVPASDYNPGASSNTTAPTVDSLYDCLP
jgi:4-amino-4-deoxy-L-arabinose transferase-like glycosyltransferase